MHSLSGNFDRTTNHPAEIHKARAIIEGGPLRPQIKGIVTFVQTPEGTEVCVSVTGLPNYRPPRRGSPPIGPHGFHIHEYGDKTVGNPEMPFQAAGSHWNPDDQPHGNHAGDLPVLFSQEGNSKMCFITNRFEPKDIVGRSVVIHENPDDYRTQPAGNAGRRLAIGIIEADRS